MLKIKCSKLDCETKWGNSKNKFFKILRTRVENLKQMYVEGLNIAFPDIV